jgi:hypothetical protein
LLDRIRDIRSSEKVFYRKVLEIYATSVVYDARTSITQQFFDLTSKKYFPPALTLPVHTPVG